MGSLELKIPPVALALLAGAAMWVLTVAAPSFAWQLPYRQVIAMILAVCGVTVALGGVASFRRASTTVNPTKPGETTSLVTTGIYRLSRNPMYLGFLLALVAWAVFLANLLALFPVVAFIAYMNRFQIVPEERVLSVMFGNEFEAYKQRVRRWV